MRDVSLVHDVHSMCYTIYTDKGQQTRINSVPILTFALLDPEHALLYKMLTLVVNVSCKHSCYPQHSLCSLVACCVTIRHVPVRLISDQSSTCPSSGCHRSS